MDEKTDGRVYGLDILKAICAFGIVLIHTNFRGNFRYYAIAIARIAVPVFFMITGYFYTYSEQKKRQLVSIKKIFVLSMISTVIYFFYTIVIGKISGLSITDIISDKMGIAQFFKWIFLNECPFGLHLWYLYALLYCLIIVFVLKKLEPARTESSLLISTPFLLCVDLAIGRYSLIFSIRCFHMYL